MRQLRLTVRTAHLPQLRELIEQHDGRAVRVWPATGEDRGDGEELGDGGEGEVYAELNLTNGRVGDFLLELEELDVATVTMAPQSVLALAPGRDQAPDDLVDVEALSPQEVYLAGLQSVGSWTGFLGYAAVGAVIAWIGLLVDSMFLLVASMLIAPFAGPAMNAALATATGDLGLFRRTVGRYAAAIGVFVSVAAAFHAVLGTENATNAMTETANLSAVAVLLPLTAGAAGALNLMQAESSSLVSGAATGVLVAAALAPPAGLVGMAAVIGEWSMVGSGVFLLALQLAGLNLAGAVVFRLYGQRPGRARYGRGARWVSWAAGAASLAVVVALVAVQLDRSPSLQRSSVQQEISAELSTIVDDDPEAGLVEVNARFTRPEIAGQDTLLAVIYVQPVGGTDPDELEARLEEELATTISDRYGVVALVTVTAIPPP